MDRSTKKWAWSGWTLAATLVFALAGCGCGNNEDNNVGKTVEPPKDAKLQPDAVPGGGGTASNNAAGGTTGSTDNSGSGAAQQKAGGFPPPPDH